MLVRAARRKAQYDAFPGLRLHPGPLYLPWLCPAQLRHQRRHGHSSSPSAAAPSQPPLRPTSAAPSTPPSTLRGRQSPSSRQLATAAAEVRVFPDDYVPFDGGNMTQHASSPPRPFGWSSNRSTLSNLRDFDPASPLIINTSLVPPQRRFNGRGGADSGTTADLHLTLETCLKVGWLDRAAALVRRLASIYAPEVPDLLHAHNAYLRTLITRVLSTRDEAGYRRAQKWFEVEMHSRGVAGDATTFALLIKGSLQLLLPPKLERTVRRYMELATAAGHDVEMLNLPILSDAELYQVTHTCPTEFKSMSEEADASWKTDDALAGSKIEEDPLPEINPMSQKGMGLKSVKQSISQLAARTAALSTIPAEEGFSLERNQQTRASHRQEQLERDVIQSTVDRWQKEADMDKGLWKVRDRARKGQLGARSWEWYEGLQVALKEEIKLVEEAAEQVATQAPDAKSQATQERHIYGPFIRGVPVDRLAALTILTCLNRLCDRAADRGARLSQLAISLGQAVEDESEVIATRSMMKMMGGDRKIKMLKDATEVQSVRWSFKKFIKSQGLTVTSRDGALQRAHDQATVERPHIPWPIRIKAKVGSILVARLMSTAKIPVSRKHPETGEEITQDQPAFSHGYQHTHGKKLGVLHGNPALMNELKMAPLYIGMVKSLPMVAEPIAWSGFRQGGYYGYRQSVMRVRDENSTQREHVEVAAERGDMEQIWEGLNVLSKTPWQINHAVFKVMVEAWNTGEKIANIPPEHPDLKSPVEPAPSAPDADRRKWMRAMVSVQNQRSGLQSQRCSQNLQLEIARAFYNETFYFPHNIDFRGRAYPIPPHFNHMGADHCRGLLLFADAKPLGASGLRWLKIHVANVYGFDKASFREREEFTMEHLSQIYDSATNPLSGDRWWLTAEDPWQFLAACIEIKTALDAPDPTQHMSRLPLHLDGTCNGLQHYAALGGDMAGARQVNLEPGDRPSDVYTGVAELVKREIAADALAGDPVAQLLDGKLTRKVVKQTVMTNVYGVTFVGASAQVRARLAESIPSHVIEAARLDLGQLSRYVAKKIFRSLGTLFSGAHDIQYWLTECANRISRALTPEQLAQLAASGPSTKKATQSVTITERQFRAAQRRIDCDPSYFRLPVTWTTPLKMPVVQPYRAAKTTRVVTAIQGMSINQPSNSSRVDRRKQLQGFPPNFIHSLDATHMFLSALKSHELGLTFAAVHDSFWTHACDMDVLARVLREAFIRMHSEDIIGRLAAEFRARYQGCYYQATLKRGSVAAKEIIAWRKQFKADEKTKAGTKKRYSLEVKELLLERERLELLASEDEADRAAGERMVTPASIFAESGGGDRGLSPPDFSNELAKVPGVKPTGRRGGKEKLIKAAKGEDVDAMVEEEEISSEDGAHCVLDDEHVDEATASDGADEKEVVDEVTKKEKKELKRSRFGPLVQVWLPLTFPDVPAKGDLDISRLKDSLYFFC